MTARLVLGAILAQGEFIFTADRHSYHRYPFEADAPGLVRWPTSRAPASSLQPDLPFF